MGTSSVSCASGPFEPSASPSPSSSSRSESSRISSDCRERLTGGRGGCGCTARPCVMHRTGTCVSCRACGLGHRGMVQPADPADPAGSVGGHGSIGSTGSSSTTQRRMAMSMLASGYHKASGQLLAMPGACNQRASCIMHSTRCVLGAWTSGGSTDSMRAAKEVYADRNGSTCWALTASAMPIAVLPSYRSTLLACTQHAQGHLPARCLRPLHRAHQAPYSLQQPLDPGQL